MLIKINPGRGDAISRESWLFTEHLGARRVFENRDEALPNFLSCFCVKSGRKHPPVTIVGDYRDRILMGQITQTSDKKAYWYWSAPSHVKFIKKNPVVKFWSQFVLFGPYQSEKSSLLLFFLCVFCLVVFPILTCKAEYSIWTVWCTAAVFSTPFFILYFNPQAEQTLLNSKCLWPN